jgi:hypothetical protein
MMHHIMTMRFVVAAAVFAVAYPLLAGELPNPIGPSSRLVPELDGNYPGCSHGFENASSKRCHAPVASRRSGQDTVCVHGAHRAFLLGRSPLRFGKMAVFVVASVVLLNLVATVMLVRSDFLTPSQKMLQLVFVWVVPFVGSILAIAIIWGARYAGHGEGDDDAEDGGDGWGRH